MQVNGKREENCGKEEAINYYYLTYYFVDFL